MAGLDIRNERVDRTTRVRGRRDPDHPHFPALRVEHPALLQQGKKSKGGGKRGEPRRKRGGRGSVIVTSSDQGR